MLFYGGSGVSHGNEIRYRVWAWGRFLGDAFVMSGKVSEAISIGWEGWIKGAWKQQ